MGLAKGKGRVPYTMDIHRAASLLNREVRMEFEVGGEELLLAITTFFMASLCLERRGTGGILRQTTNQG